MPIVAKASSMPFSGQRSQPASTAQRSAGSPRLSTLVEGAPVVGDEHGDHLRTGRSRAAPSSG